MSTTHPKGSGQRAQNRSKNRLTMDPIQNPAIPPCYVNFAKACAALAESHGIKSFQLKITPSWRDPSPENVRVHGDIQINYTAMDGRGRPCANLAVYLTTNTQVDIVSTPSSVN